MRKVFRALLGIAIIWLVVAGLIVVQFWPDLPQSKLQWVLLLGFGPPLYVIGEEVIGRVLSPERGDRISTHKFSFKRILFAIPVAALVLAIGWWLSWLLSSGAA